MNVELTAEDIAARLHCTARWVRARYIQGWRARAHDPRMPRVTRRLDGRRGRPAYLVDRASFERWLCPTAA